MSAAALYAGAQAAPAAKPAPPPGKIPRHVLVIAQTQGFEHDSIPDAMAAVYNMGQQTGLWDTIMRTDTELITKKELTKKREENRAITGSA
jgi:hypothetical protein